MELLILGLLGLAAGSFALFDNDDDPVEAPDDSSGEAPDPTTFVTDGSSLIGTAEDDIFVLDQNASGPLETTIDSGDGDDIIDLSGWPDSDASVSADVSGGAGNDQISGFSEGTISGGQGNDTITSELLSGTVHGDDGDDQIEILSEASDIALVFGGAGNDTIDGLGSDNIRIHGGEGDDVLHTRGAPSSGAGYEISSNGGDGNDTLHHDIPYLPIKQFETTPVNLAGGSGEDTFEISFVNESGSGNSADDDSNPLQETAIALTDFEPGVDQLNINLGDIVEYDSLTAEMEEVGELVLTLSGSDGIPDQQFRITGAGLTLDDVNFLGRNVVLHANMIV